MFGEERVSGKIFRRKDRHTPEGFSYVIVSPITNQGWGLPVDGITSDDLRVLADELERLRKV